MALVRILQLQAAAAEEEERRKFPVHTWELPDHMVLVRVRSEEVQS